MTNLWVCMCSVTSVMSSSLRPHGLWPSRLSPWDFPGKNIEVALPSSRESSQCRNQPHVSCIAGGLFTTEPLGKPHDKPRYCIRRLLGQGNLNSLLQHHNSTTSILQHSAFFPGSSDGKESTCFDPCIGKIPWRRKWLPTPVFCPKEFHGQRILVGYPGGVHGFTKSQT